MGRPKLALPLGDRTILEHVVAALRDAGADVLVVLAPHVAELAPLAERAGATVLMLPAATPHMRATIEHGLAFLEERFHPDPESPWLLSPADHPTLDPAFVRRMFEQFALRPECSIAVPTFEGKRGHPTLIRWKHVAGIRAFSPEHGLNRYLRQFNAETLEVPADSADILLDLDTPEDYERLRRKLFP